MPSTHVSVRLSHGAWTRYAAEAEAHDLALGTYLRRRLEQQDQTSRSVGPSPLPRSAPRPERRGMA